MAPVVFEYTRGNARISVNLLVPLAPRAPLQALCLLFEKICKLRVVVVKLRRHWLATCMGILGNLCSATEWRPWVALAGEPFPATSWRVVHPSVPSTTEIRLAYPHGL